jgi:Putative auto-transporter adhesin, head GIN domain
MTRISPKTSLLLLTFPTLLFACQNIFGKRVHGDGNVTTQDRSVTEFKNIEVGGAAKVFVSQGDQHSVKVEVDENLQQFVEVYQEGDKVVVREKSGFNLDPTGDLKIYVTSPVYNNIDVSGACDIIGQTPINNPENLEMHISGAGDMKMEVNAPHISAEVSGSGNIDLKGETKAADLSLTGAGHAHCFDLKSETTKVDISGAGSAQVFASVRLDAEVSGAGSVDYKGGAAVDQHVSGAGSVHKAD